MRELGELNPEVAEMKTRNLLIKLLRQDVHMARLVLARIFVCPQLDLSQSLVRERVRHDETWVTCGAAEVHEATLCENDDAVSILKGEAINLRLDVLPLCGGLEAGHLDLVVEVTNVTDNGHILHGSHAFESDNVFVARGSDKNVDFGDNSLHLLHDKALHGSLQGADRIHFVTTRCSQQL